MVKKFKKLAIIPARIGSRRILKKNIRKLDGVPILSYTIRAAISSKIFDKIHVSTDSEEVIKVCQDFDIAVDFMRPHGLSKNNVKLNDVIKFVISEFEDRKQRFDFFCMLWPTAPLRNAEDIKKSFKLITKYNANAVVGVSDYDLPFYCGQKLDNKGYISKIFKNKFWSSKNNKVICDNGSLVWNKVSAFKKFKTWLPPQTIGFLMPKYKSVDLNEEEDWHLLEFYYNKYAKK